MKATGEPYARVLAMPLDEVLRVIDEAQAIEAEEGLGALLAAALKGG